ncbi:MAG: Zn-ribbon domain-containing OB-fold protein [Acidimicrobiales bacterium]
MPSSAPTLASGPPIRLLPRLDGTNDFFWSAGAEGVLRFQRCVGCRRYVHPPSPVCPYCLDAELVPEVVSGRGVLHSFTVNEQQWIPGSDPYVIGLVTIAEQHDVRLMTNIVECALDQLHVGMVVEVVFEHHGDVWLPLFRPAGDP